MAMSGFHRKPGEPALADEGTGTLARNHQCTKTFNRLKNQLSVCISQYGKSGARDHNHILACDARHTDCQSVAPTRPTPRGSLRAFGARDEPAQLSSPGRRRAGPRPPGGTHQISSRRTIARQSTWYSTRPMRTSRCRRSWPPRRRRRRGSPRSTTRCRAEDRDHRRAGEQRVRQARRRAGRTGRAGGLDTTTGRRVYPPPVSRSARPRFRDGPDRSGRGARPAPNGAAPCAPHRPR